MEDEAMNLYQCMRADAVSEYERDRAIERAVVLEAQLKRVQSQCGALALIAVTFAALLIGYVWGPK